MPELRRDPIVGRWVIISSERSRRPTDFKTILQAQNKGRSPFAPGNEAETPPEVFALRPPDTLPDTPGWTLRVIPNKYPALKPDISLSSESNDLYESISGSGFHEVIVETPDGNTGLGELSDAELSALLGVFRDRIRALKKDQRIKYILIFKNHGQAAGATLSHPHSQLIGLPVVPHQVSMEVEGARHYYHRLHRCVFCDIIRRETREEHRMVLNNDDFTALMPYAARVPYETWIMPREHASHFEDLPDLALGQLAVMLKTIVKKINSALDKPPFNLVLHTAPVQEAAMPHFHWHFELLPRTGTVAGFEWGSGCYINSTSPETAAQNLRAVVV